MEGWHLVRGFLLCLNLGDRQRQNKEETEMQGNVHMRKVDLATYKGPTLMVTSQHLC